MSAISFDRSPVTLRQLSAAGAVVTALFAVVVYQVLSSFVLLAVGTAAGFALYALFGGVPDGDLRSFDIGDNTALPGLLTLGFLLSSAVALFSLSGAYYTKPLLYYVAVAVAAGFLGLRIILTDAHRTNGVLAVLYGLNTFVTNQLAFPLGLNGPDIGDHLGLARTIVETAHIVGGGLYNGFPAQHLIAASTAVASGTPVTGAYRLVGIFGMVLTIPVTYLIAWQYGSRRFAVLGMLVVGSMEYVVYRAGHPSKLAYVLPLLVFTFATVAYLSSKRSAGMTALFALFSTALVFTHAHTAFVTLVFLGTVGIGHRLLDRIDQSLPGWSLFARVGPDDLTLVDSGLSDRTHMLALLFAIAFVTQFLYFAGFFGQFVSIAAQYVDVLFQTGGPDSVKETPRFSTIPFDAILLNTIGSGLLTALAVLGALHQFERRVRFTAVLFGWMVVAAVLMVGGVLFDVPFALPNRVYVITELTGAGLFAAAGIVYLVRQSESRRFGRALVVFVVAVIVAFTLFSTASTIAGIETSPFNEDVPHRTWYGMVEEDAAASFAADHGRGDITYARGFPVDREAGALNYSRVNESEIVGLNLQKIQAGVTVRGGAGRIGTGIWFIPDRPRAGLADQSRLYDNGPIELYRFRAGG